MLTGVSASVAGLETTVTFEVGRRQTEWQDAQTAFFPYFSQPGKFDYSLQLVLVGQVDTVIALEGALATQDTLGSIVMKC